MRVFISKCLILILFSISGYASERIIRDIEFATIDNNRLALDLYLPEGVNNPPLVLWIHGGGWMTGSRSDCPIRWMTGNGLAIASISYRLTDKAIFPAQIHDCKSAVRWLRANQEAYGYAAEKLAVAGASAGGMLATLLGTSGGLSELEGTVGGNLEQCSRVQAVIDFYGPTDFVLRSKTQPSQANEPGSGTYRLLGGGANEKLALAKMASAAFHVSSDDPPLLVYHGEKDKFVLPDQSKRIHDVYSAAGLPITLITLKEAGHGGKEFYSAENRQIMINFLQTNFLLRDGASDENSE
jgi:acetyl esterase/lipase